MFRIAALALLLAPGVAHAQKFVSVADDSELPLVQLNADGGTDGSTAPVQDTTDGIDASEVNASAFGDSIVFDGATVEEIEALLANASANAMTADEANALIGRVATDSEGEVVLALDVAGSDVNTSATPAAATDVATLELGECNDGTDWVANNTHCHNAYPTDGD